MKKVILLLSVVVLGFMSCSKSGDEVTPLTSNPNGTLPIKIISTFGTSVVTLNYFYNGNKLTRIQSSNGDYLDYTYTNDLITGYADYRSNVLVGNISCTYNTANNLVQKLYLSSSTNQGKKEVYTYDADGTVSLAIYSGNLTVQTTNTENYKVFFQNGLAIKREEYKLINGVMVTKTSNYTYDTKNYTFNSVLGYNKMMLDYFGGIFGCPNNIVSETKSASNTNATSTLLSTQTYNTSNYPITQTHTFSSGGSLVNQIFYQ
jgi:hypothetical protein